MLTNQYYDKKPINREKRINHNNINNKKNSIPSKNIKKVEKKESKTDNITEEKNDSTNINPDDTEEIIEKKIELIKKMPLKTKEEQLTKLKAIDKIPDKEKYSNAKDELIIEIDNATKRVEYDPEKNPIQPSGGFFYKIKMFLLGIFGLFFFLPTSKIYMKFRGTESKNDTQTEELSKRLLNLKTECKNATQCGLKINTSKLTGIKEPTESDIKIFKKIPFINKLFVGTVDDLNNVSGCDLGNFINIKPIQNQPECFLLYCFGHAMCGYIDHNGKKYIFDNGGFSFSPSFWSKQDFEQNNITYIPIKKTKAEMTKENIKWCGPSALDKIKSIYDIYNKLYKNPNYSDWSGFPEKELAKNIATDVKMYVKEKIIKDNEKKEEITQNKTKHREEYLERPKDVNRRNSI